MMPYCDACTDLATPKDGDHLVLEYDRDTAPAQPTDDGQNADGGCGLRKTTDRTFCCDCNDQTLVFAL